jgi:endogenous inhibitor of DNA gyrase (YacG/DUF329 family)
MARCPICNEEVKPRAQNVAFPFCSPRCKTIDLGKWLSEEYRVPAEEADEDPSRATPDADGGSPSRRDMRN